MRKIELIAEQMRQLRITETSRAIEQLVMDAESKDLSYQDFLASVVQHEIDSRSRKQYLKRLKWAELPEYKRLDDYNLHEQHTLSKRQLNQLKELGWVEQAFNILLLGPPGVGKTLLGIGLVTEALEKGYKACFVSMDDLLRLLKTQEISRTSKTRIKRIEESNLVVIDDLMMIANDHVGAGLFFQLVSRLHNQTSVVITSNKGPDEWSQLIGDPALTTAILDRLLHRCEVIYFNDEHSYRMRNRKTIFGEN